MDFFGFKKAKPIIVIPNEPPTEQYAQAHVPEVKAKPVPIAIGALRPEPARVNDGTLQRLLAAFNGPVNQPPQVQPQAAPARVQAVPRQPAAGPDYNAMTNAQRDDMFWGIIDRLQWRNASDGFVNVRQVQNIIRDLNQTHERIFREKYNELFEMMKNRLEADGMFIRNGIISLVDQAKIISHAIAMGKDQFYTLLDDPAIYQFLIEIGECQSLDIHLPDDMQH